MDDNTGRYIVVFTMSQSVLRSQVATGICFRWLGVSSLIVCMCRYGNKNYTCNIDSIPIIMAAILLLIDTHPEHQGTRNPNFVYGTSQAILAVSLLVLCFTVTVGCLILMQRHRRRISRYWDSVMQHDDDESAPLTNDTSATITIGNGQGDSIGNGVGHALVVGNGGLPTINEDSPIVDIEDLFSGATTSTSAVAKRRLPATINDDSGVDM